MILPLGSGSGVGGESESDEDGAVLLLCRVSGVRGVSGAVRLLERWLASALVRER